MVIKRPEDHLRFLRDVLTHAARAVNMRRIIIIGPPCDQKREIAELLAKQLSIHMITLDQIDDERSKVSYFHRFRVLTQVTTLACALSRFYVLNYLRV